MSVTSSLRINLERHQSTEMVMTTGNVLYLVMCIGAFAVFSAALAYESWQQSRLGPEAVPVPADHRDMHSAVTA
jgi:hypothetical protein